MGQEANPEGNRSRRDKRSNFGKFGKSCPQFRRPPSKVLRSKVQLPLRPQPVTATNPAPSQGRVRFGGPRRPERYFLARLRRIRSPKYANHCVSRNGIPVLLPGASSQCHPWTGLYPLVVLLDGRRFSLDEFGTKHRFRPLIAPALQCMRNATRRWPVDGIRSLSK